MSLAPGFRIGNYEILGPLGSGGMGEVYRGRDTRLDRVVAIKALPAGLAGDAERLVRFEQEARLLAAVAHPHIAGIHGIEDAQESEGGPYLVLEFVDGETLAERLARGPLSVRETLKAGVQIASAVDAAHERGIVHRDLKPGNIMIAAGGIKVLDFGLAKGSPIPDSTSGLSASPTVPTPATADGIILGTAAYMSPEQARGKPVDKRGDVWAFGCILLECLTGRQVFWGETASDVIALILEREPDWSLLPPATPPRLADLLRRCLTKDQARRPRDIGDLGRELEAIAQDLESRPTVPPAAKDVPSLAVLYFENLAKDPESEYFCSGITEDILTDLSKINGLRVASKNAVGRYRGEDVDLAVVARDLGVKAVLEGSVRRAGDRIRITTQLINAADGFQLWAERFDRTLDDVFAVQDEIAKAIVEALRVAMTPSDIQRIARDRPNDVKAYDLYLKGREEYGRYREAPMREAMKLFQQAIDLDPGYALAWAGLADCHGQMVQYDWTDNRDDSLRLGLEAARKAVSLDPKLPEAYKAEALVLRYRGDQDGAVQALRHALQADPDFTPALVNLAVDRMVRADLAGAERPVRRALEIDPQDAFSWLWLANVLLWTDREDACLETLERARAASDSTFYVTGGHVLRIRVHLRRGDLDGAREALKQAQADKADPGALRVIEALLIAQAGRGEEALRCLPDTSEGIWHMPAMLQIGAAAAYRAGDMDRALDILRRSSVRDLLQLIARLDPELHPFLDREPLAPRRLDMTLVWPLEAPMLDPAVFALFREVRIESGRPEGSNILGTASQIT